MDEAACRILRYVIECMRVECFAKSWSAQRYRLRRRAVAGWGWRRCCWRIGYGNGKVGSVEEMVLG